VTPLRSIALRIAPFVLTTTTLACTHAPPGADTGDAGAAPCDDYAHVLAACRGTGANGAIAVEAQAALADQLARAPGGRAPLEARCRQLSAALHADPACEASLTAQAKR
jgi:hypothetical protein